ncbi:MAG: hypothetical protein ACXVPU_18040, partial [Bacteroidia bacterium]
VRLGCERCRGACAWKFCSLKLFVSEPTLSEDEGIQDKKKRRKLKKRNLGFIHVAPPELYYFFL